MPTDTPTPAAPDQIAPETPQPGQPGWPTMMLIAVSFYCAVSLDPFGIGTASAERSEQAALRITAPFYRDSGKVVVVLIDDHYLRQVQRNWPLPYADQGRLLRRIYQGAPSVVYLDMLYRQAHTNLATDATAPLRDDPLDLVQPIESFDGTRLILSTEIRTSLREKLLPSLCTRDDFDQRVALMDPDSLLPELRQWSARRPGLTKLAALGWWGCGDQYPLHLPGDPEGTSPTPAMAMLEAWCATGNRQEEGCRTLLPPLRERALPPMVVRWGAFPPAEQKPFYTAGTCQQYAEPGGGVGLWRAMRTSLTQFVLGVFEDLRASPRPNLALPCPAVTVLPASVVRFGDVDQVSELLRNKIVLVGAQVTGVTDWHLSPVHGQVPGVILHAAAIDNLLSLGQRYASNFTDGWLLPLTIVVLGLIAFVVPIIVILVNKRHKGLVSLFGLLVWVCVAWFLWKNGASAGSVFAAFIIAIAIDLLMPMQTIVYMAIVLVLSLGAALMVRLGAAPANWIGMILIGLALATTAKPYFFRQEQKRFPHPAAFLGPSFLHIQQRLESIRLPQIFHRTVQRALGVTGSFRRRASTPPTNPTEI